MKKIFVLALSLFSLTGFAQRYQTNVIENVNYVQVEETNDEFVSAKNNSKLHLRTVRVTDHKKKENGVLVIDFSWKSYHLVIDKDAFQSETRKMVKSTKLKSIFITESSCENGNILTLKIQTKTLDPEEFNENGVSRLTKTKYGSMKIDTKKHCNGYMPEKVILKTL